jgi:hypothetical protein
MKHLFTFVLFSVVTSLGAQPVTPTMPVKIPESVKASVGRITSLTVENSPAQFNWLAYPADGIIIRREHSEDPKHFNLLIEIQPGADGKAKRTEYGIFFPAANKICVVLVGDQPKPAPPVVPDPQPQPPPPGPSSDIEKLKTDVASIQAKLNALTETVKAGGITSDQLESLTASVAEAKKQANSPLTGKSILSLVAALDTVTAVLSKSPISPTPDDDIATQLASLRKSVAAIKTTLDAFRVETDKRLTALENLPNPPNPPPNPPVPNAKAASLTFLVLWPTPKTVLVTEDQGFRDWLKANGVNVYGITTQAALDARPKFAGITSPAVILTDASNNLIGAVAITDLNSVKTYVSKFLPAK